MFNWHYVSISWVLVPFWPLPFLAHAKTQLDVVQTNNGKYRESIKFITWWGQIKTWNMMCPQDHVPSCSGKGSRVPRLSHTWCSQFNNNKPLAITLPNIYFYGISLLLFPFPLPVPIYFPPNTCSPPRSPTPPRACPPQTIAPLWQRFVGVCWTTQDRKSKRKMCASSSSFCVHGYNHRLNHLRLTACQLTA